MELFVIVCGKKNRKKAQQVICSCYYEPCLCSLLENVLERFEHENGDLLVVATLCLLEASRGGLLESELLDILGDEADLVPPSPFEEKGEQSFGGTSNHRASFAFVLTH